MVRFRVSGMTYIYIPYKITGKIKRKLTMRICCSSQARLKQKRNQAFRTAKKLRRTPHRICREPQLIQMFLISFVYNKLMDSRYISIDIVIYN